MGVLTERDELLRAVRDSLDALDDWQLRAMARMARLDPRRGYGNPPFVLGLGKIEYEDGKTRSVVDLDELHRAGHGAAHGMIAFGLVDNAMGRAVTAAASDARVCVALEIKCQFVRPLRIGRVSVEGETVHLGQRVAVTAGRILDAEGDVAVLATGTYYLMSRSFEEPPDESTDRL